MWPSRHDCQPMDRRHDVGCEVNDAGSQRYRDYVEGFVQGFVSVWNLLRSIQILLYLVYRRDGRLA